MNIDMFRFRVRDTENETYLDEDCLWLRSDGYAYEGQYQLSTSDFIVERCTGLKDKHGNLIYEGDIVCYDDTPYNGYATKKIGVVVYRKAQFCYKYSDCLGGLYQPLVPSDDFWQRKTEIIGNVHEMKVCEESGEEKENVN